MPLSPLHNFFSPLRVAHSQPLFLSAFAGDHELAHGAPLAMAGFPIPFQGIQKISFPFGET